MSMAQATSSVCLARRSAGVPPNACRPPESGRMPWKRRRAWSAAVRGSTASGAWNALMVAAELARPFLAR